MAETVKRAGSETRAAAQRIALELFSAKGYEATSLREIAERLGITKASLYYHFRSKDEIVRSILAERGAEAARLLDWVRAQPPGPDLAERAVLRWIESVSVDKLHGIRFVNANPLLMRNIALDAGAEIRDNLQEVVRIIAGDNASPTRLLLIRMALLSINSAASAADPATFTDEHIITAAREMATALINFSITVESRDSGLGQQPRM